MYHQFHDGLGYKFPESYTVDLKRAAEKADRSDPFPGVRMRERAFCDVLKCAKDRRRRVNDVNDYLKKYYY